MKISWRDRKSNEEVLRMVGEERHLIKVIKTRQRNWLGHILRGEGLLKEVIEGRFKGSRQRGRKRKSMLEDLKGGKSYHEMKRLAEDHVSWNLVNP